MRVATSRRSWLSRSASTAACSRVTSRDTQAIDVTRPPASRIGVSALSHARAPPASVL